MHKNKIKKASAKTSSGRIAPSDEHCSYVTLLGGRQVCLIICPETLDSTLSIPNSHPRDLYHRELSLSFLSCCCCSIYPEIRLPTYQLCPIPSHPIPSTSLRGHLSNRINSSPSNPFPLKLPIHIKPTALHNPAIPSHHDG